MSLRDSAKRTESSSAESTTTTAASSSALSTLLSTSFSLGDGSTVIVQPLRAGNPNNDDRPKFVKCESLGPFVNPLAQPPGLSAEQVNRQLNLNLGQSVVTPDNKILLWVIRFLNNVLISWWEHFLFQGWNALPLAWRRNFCNFLWKVYFPLHKRLLGKRTGIHRDASYEYHALTTCIWGGRLFPVTVQRMRFTLSQLSVWTEGPMTTKCITKINEPFIFKNSNNRNRNELPQRIPERQKDHCTVKGLFLHRNGPENPTEWTLMWIYGGAFLSGDTDGNAGKADSLAQQTGMDIFLCDYRLVPEWHADDINWDICLAYKWLTQRRNHQKIILLGISSGAACCVRLMQYIAEMQRGETLVPPSYLDVLVENMELPAGAVLMGPFADFTTPKGSLVHYCKHDLIVTQRVLEMGVPYMNSHLPDPKAYSPVHRSFQGLPPLCVVTSEHEAVYDMTVDLINKARRDKVAVTVGCWRYMCHVFPFFDAFIPEGKQSMEFIAEWIKYICNEKRQAESSYAPAN